jgi:hypothetical protein
LSVLGGMIRIVVALFAVFLPRAVWIRWTDRLPVFPMVLPAAILTVGLGGVFGVIGYLDFALDTASRTNAAMLSIAEKQSTGEIGSEVEASAGMAASLTMLAMFTFAFFTVKGAACTYLVLSGLYRALAWIVHEPQGDPILILLRSLALVATGRTRENLARRDFQRRLGREVPDRMQLGVDCGFPNADFVVVASREKPEWTRGTVLFTRRGCYRVGEEDELETPEGLRILYPLTEVGQADVMRKIVRFELPRLEAPPPTAEEAPKPEDDAQPVAEPETVEV